MSKTGEFLKKRRELEGISLDDIAAQTMIAKKYIEALEQGNHDVFPAEVYAKGFLRNYANAIGFNEKEINELNSQYELEWQETRNTHFTSQVAESEEKIPLQGSIPSVSKTNTLLYIIIFLLISGLAGFLTFYITKQKTSNESDPATILEEKDISNAENAIGKRIEKIKDIIKQEMDKSTKPANKVSKKVLVEVFASEKVWMQATIDNKKTQEILLEADKTIKWQADEKIFLTVGNAGGVVFKVNGEYIGALGRKGEVKKILVTAAGPKIMNTQEAKEEKPVSKLLSDSGTLSSSPTIPEQPTSTVSSE